MGTIFRSGYGPFYKKVNKIQESRTHGGSSLDPEGSRLGHTTVCFSLLEAEVQQPLYELGLTPLRLDSLGFQG